MDTLPTSGPEPDEATLLEAKKAIIAEILRRARAGDADAISAMKKILEEPDA